MPFQRKRPLTGLAVRLRIPVAVWTASGNTGRIASDWPCGTVCGTVGAVYEVEPFGDLQPDHDYDGYMPGTSCETASALVVRVVVVVDARG